MLPKSAVITTVPGVLCDARGVQIIPKSPEPYYWAPTAEGGMTATDLQKLWRPTLWLGTTQNSVRFGHLFWREGLGSEWVHQDHYVVSNFPYDKRLDAALKAVLDFFSATGATEAKLPRGGANIDTALRLQQECLAAFDACVALLERPKMS